MATNDFLVFASASGANVVSQATYAAASYVPAGFSAGIAASSQLNKVWRQSSIMASMIGSFITKQTGQNVVDDGTTATIEANFETAIQNTTRIKVLGANLNLYVNGSTGNDGNAGLTPTTAFATIQAAVVSLYTLYDLNGHVPLINVAAGTYAPVLLAGLPLGCINPVQILGASSGTCQITATNANCIDARAGALVTVNGFTLVATGSAGANGFTQGCGLYSQGGSVINFTNDMVFGNCASAHMYATNGGLINANGNAYSASGSSVAHVYSTNGGAIFVNNCVMTLSMSVATAFIVCNLTSVVWVNASVFNGSVTGSKFNVTLNGVIFTNGTNSTTYLPGNSAGAISLGGIYN